MTHAHGEQPRCGEEGGDAPVTDDHAAAHPARRPAGAHAGARRTGPAGPGPSGQQDRRTSTRTPMSHLRAPAARADRREGGRHGRPVARPAPSLPETHLRPQLLRLAVLPPIAVALSGCAAVLFTVRSTGAQPSLILWGVLAGAVSVALAGILIAAVAADRAARTVSDRVGALRRSSARREADLRVLVEGLRRG